MRIGLLCYLYFRKLIDRGANPVIKNKSGKMALDIAKKHRNNKILLMLTSD